MSKLQAIPGTLVTSDEPTIVFIKYLNSHVTKSPFILQELDSKNLFVRTDCLAFIRQSLKKRLLETRFEGETEDQPYLAQP